jgi:hypothetical protein
MPTGSSDPHAAFCVTTGMARNRHAEEFTGLAGKEGISAIAVNDTHDQARADNDPVQPVIFSAYS